MKKEIKMERVFITPTYAALLLEKNRNVRKISAPTVDRYAEDIKNGRWTEDTGTGISFDCDGNLIDGQHRLAAIVKAKTGIWCWFCYNCDPNGIYDENRVRNQRDQLAGKLPDVYLTPLVAGCIRILHNKSLGISQNTKISSMTFENFVREHQKELDPFFLSLSKGKTRKITKVTTVVALFNAYVAGIDLDKIFRFYEVLRSGLPEEESERSIIAYRNWLICKTVPGTSFVSEEEVARCQNALYHYLNNDQTRLPRSRSSLIWPWPWKDGAAS